MIWTAIFENRNVEVFSTHNNCYEEAQSRACQICDHKLLALIKGNHTGIKFF